MGKLDDGRSISDRVAVLLVRHLTKAVLRRRMGAAQTEPYWLSAGQYKETDLGIQVLPDKAADLIAYAERNQLRPLGMVIVADNGGYREFFNEDVYISPIDGQFVKELFRAHAHFWFCEIPQLMRGHKES
jgi:hypothetical protein